MMRTMKKGRSLGRKLTFAIIIISFLLVIVALLFGYMNYADRTYKHYKTLASNLAKTAVTQLDADQISTYLQTMKTDKAYDDMLEELFKIKNNNNIEFLYVIKIEGDSMTYIMDADVNEATKCELGMTVPIHKGIVPYLDRLEQGVPAYIQKDEQYGWLSICLEPLIDSKGELVAMVGVDISMTEVMEDRYDFLLIMCLGMALTAVIFIGAFLLYIKKGIVKHINQLAAAAREYVSNRSNSTDPGNSRMARLDIHTGDEIEKLAEAFKQMELDMNTYIDNLTRVTAEKERIGTELNVAKQIQASLLPCVFPAFPERQEFDIYARMDPAREVGGDFYDFFLTNDRYLWVVIADVSDKGVAAALFMVISKTLIKNHAEFRQTPAEVFNIVNDQLCKNNEAGMFVTAFMGRLDLETGDFIFANAGHNHPLLWKEQSGFDWLKTKPGLVLAGMEDIRYKNYETTLAPGDRLFLYTDGVTEALSKDKELYGDARLLAVLNREGVAKLPLEELVNYIREDISRFASGAEQSDDITMLVLEYRK